MLYIKNPIKIFHFRWPALMRASFHLSEIRSLRAFLMKKWRNVSLQRGTQFPSVLLSDHKYNPKNICQPLLLCNNGWFIVRYIFRFSAFFPGLHEGIRILINLISVFLCAPLKLPPETGYEQNQIDKERSSNRICKPGKNAWSDHHRSKSAQNQVSKFKLKGWFAWQKKNSTKATKRHF